MEHFSQYTVVYLEDPQTCERLNIGIAAWAMQREWVPTDVERVNAPRDSPAKPERLIWYFNRNWQRLRTFMGPASVEQWKLFAENMELRWSLTKLLEEIAHPVGPYTWLRFTPPHASTHPEPSITLGDAGRHFIKRNAY